MEDNVATPDTDAAALAAAKEGYARRAGAPAPAAAPAAVDTPAAPPLAEKAPSPAPAAPAPAAKADEQPAPKAEPEQPSTDRVAAQLEDLKAQIRDLKANGADQQAINRLHGQIGGITRVLNKLEKQLTPTDNELTAAIAQAEKTAAEYPDIGGPMLNVIKALAAQLPDKAKEAEAAAPATTAAPATSDVYTAEEKTAIKFLDEAHPDRFEINQSAEWQKWLASKGPEYERTFRSSWNPVVLAAGYAEFKQAQAAAKAAAEAKKQTKKDRLEAAHTPEGVAAPPKPNEPTDIELAKRGYARYAGKSL
jgi:hypothetical protein